MVVGAGPPGGLQRRRLSFQQPIQGKTNQVYVFSEAELLSALGNVPGAEGNCYGKEIVIVGNILISQTITLTTQHAGLTISSPSAARLSTKSPLTTRVGLFGPGDSIFRLLINAQDVTIKGLYLTSSFQATYFVLNLAERTTVSDITVDTSGTLTSLVNFGNNGLVIERCKSSTLPGTSASLITGSVGVNSGRISHNYGFDGGIDGVDLGNTVVMGNSFIGGWTNSGGSFSGNTVVMGNIMTGDIILLGGGFGTICLNCVISGNAMRGNDINTSGSDGTNTITGNTDVGTLSAHGTDDTVGGNT